MNYHDFLSWLDKLRQANSQNKDLSTLIEQTTQSLKTANAEEAYELIAAKEPKNPPGLLSKIISLDRKTGLSEKSKVIYLDSIRTAGMILEELDKPSGETRFKSSYSQAQPKVLQAQPEVLQAQPEVLQAQPEVLQEQPEVLQEQPKVLQEQPEVLQEQPKVLQEQPKVLQAQPKVLQAQPKVLQEQPKVLQDQFKVLRDQFKVLRVETKLSNLQKILTPYVSHLKDSLISMQEEYSENFLEAKDSSKWKEAYPEIAITMDKVRAVESYLEILKAKEKTPQEKLGSFKAAYLKDWDRKTGEHLLEKRRDSFGMTIAKFVASLLVIPIFLGIWNVKGKQVDKEINDIAGISHPKPGQ